MDRRNLVKEPGDQEMLESLAHLRDTLEQGFLLELARSLPFPDLVFDRWERAKALSFGEGTSMYDSVLVLGDVKVGKHCWIGPSAILDGSGGLQIGSYCTISAGVQIYSHDNIKKTLSSGSSEIERSKVTIGDNVYIGPSAIVRRGVNIGSLVVVGAFSYVNRDVPSGSIVFGQPARVVGSVKSDASGIWLDYNDMGDAS